MIFLSVPLNGFGPITGRDGLFESLGALSTLKCDNQANKLGQEREVSPDHKNAFIAFIGYVHA